LLQKKDSKEDEETKDKLQFERRFLRNLINKYYTILYAIQVREKSFLYWGFHNKNKNTVLVISSKRERHERFTAIFLKTSSDQQFG